MTSLVERFTALPDDTDAYVVLCPQCGKFVEAIADTGMHPGRVAFEVASATADGYVVQKTTMEYVKAKWEWCECEWPEEGA